MVPRARSLALRLTLGVSLRLLPVPLLSPAEDGQGDEEQPDHHQEEAAQEDEEGGLQLLVSLELRALTAGREVSILFHQECNKDLLIQQICHLVFFLMSPTLEIKNTSNFLKVTKI